MVVSKLECEDGMVGPIYEIWEGIYVNIELWEVFM